MSCEARQADEQTHHKKKNCQAQEEVFPPNSCSNRGP